MPSLGVEVRQEVPFLPKVAFALISLASVGGRCLPGFAWASSRSSSPIPCIAGARP